jgi:hypothetical protein
MRGPETLRAGSRRTRRRRHPGGCPLLFGESWPGPVSRQPRRCALYFVIPAQAGTPVAPRLAASSGAGATGFQPCPAHFAARVPLWDRLGPRLRGDDEVVGVADQLAASVQNFPRTAMGERRDPRLPRYGPGLFGWVEQWAAAVPIATHRAEQCTACAANAAITAQAGSPGRCAVGPGRPRRGPVWAMPLPGCAWMPAFAHCGPGKTQVPACLDAGRRKNVVIPANAGIHEHRGAALHGSAKSNNRPQAHGKPPYLRTVCGGPCKRRRHVSPAWATPLPGCAWIPAFAGMTALLLRPAPVSAGPDVFPGQHWAFAGMTTCWPAANGAFVPSGLCACAHRPGPCAPASLP